MKILYLHQYFNTPDMIGGTRSFEMARRLVSKGHEVHMVTSWREEDDRDDWFSTTVEGINVHWLPVPYANLMSFKQRTSAFFKFAFGATKKSINLDCDIVFATSTPLTIVMPAILTAMKLKKPMIFEVRDLWPELPKAMKVITNPIVLKCMGLMEWLAYKYADRLIALSPGIKHGIERYRPDSKNIATIPNGCDIELFSTISDNPRRPDGVSSSDLLAVYTGAHGFANGLDAIIGAAVELKKMGRNDIKVVLIGKGAVKGDLIEKAEHLKLDNVLFLDPIEKRRLVDLLSVADIGLQLLANIPAFYYGTSPNKFFDYLASGLPVLNNYPGWLADLIENHQCGLVVPPDDHTSFANALIYAADNKSELVHMGNNAKKLAKAKFDRNKLAEEFCDFVCQD